MCGEGEFGELLGCPALSGVSVRKRGVVVGVERPQIGEGADGGNFAVNQRHNLRRRSGGHWLAKGQLYFRGVWTGRRSGSGDTRGIPCIESGSVERRRSLLWRVASESCTAPRYHENLGRTVGIVWSGLGVQVAHNLALDWLIGVLCVDELA